MFHYGANCKHQVCGIEHLVLVSMMIRIAEVRNYMATMQLMLACKP